MDFGPPQAENFGVFRGYSGDFTIENHMHFGPPQAENFGFGVPQISKILVLTFTLVLTLRLVWHSQAEVRSPNTKVNTASLSYPPPSPLLFWLSSRTVKLVSKLRDRIRGTPTVFWEYLSEFLFVGKESIRRSCMIFY